MIRIAKFLFALLVLKTVVVVLVSYRDYFPPNFAADFLVDRESYFFGWYRGAFYVHIVSGPIALLLGLFLISEPLRRKRPAWHRRIGRVQVANVVLLVSPSGLAMSVHAESGTLAAVSFATLSLFTGVFALLGWRAAVKRQFQQHRLWMLRTFCLLCSAILLRVIGGTTEVLGYSGSYALAAWISWVAPLLLLEAGRSEVFQFLAAGNRE